MKTFRVTKPFTISGPAGTRDFGLGDTATEEELNPYLPDVAHCLTEIAAPAPPKPAPAVEPKETEE